MKSRLHRSIRTKAISHSSNMESAWIDKAIDHLCRATLIEQPTEVLSNQDIVYERVGRNRVYRVTHAGNPADPVFIKVALEATDFRREVLGHTIMKDLGRKLSWMGVVPVLVTDESHGLIVTRPARGEFLADILRNNLRFDKNPFRRLSRLREARNAIDLLNRWLGVFQAVPLDHAHVLTDKSPAGIRQRALRNIANIRGSWLDRQFLDDLETALRQTSVVEEPSECGLLHGDLDPNNVLISDGRITVIDFEDLGAGPTFYDTLWIENLLSRSQMRWSYIWLRSALERLQIPVHSPRLEALYRIDFELLRLEGLVDRALSGTGLTRMFTWALSRSSVREIRTLLTKLN